MENEKKKSNPFIKLGILGVVVLGIYLIFRFTPLEASNFTPEKVKDFILSFGAIAPLVYLAIYTLRGVILVIPVFAMSLTSGIGYGLFWGWLLNLTGATMGACLSFFVARYFGRGFLQSLPFFQKGALKTFDDKAGEHGFKLILFTRLVPLFQFDALNFGAGLSKIKFRDYALGSFIGMVPGAYITNSIGASLSNWNTPQFYLSIGAFILLMFIPLIYKKFKKSDASIADSIQEDNA